MEQSGTTSTHDLTRERVWLRDQLANAVRALDLARQLVELIGTADIRYREAECETIKRIIEIVDGRTCDCGREKSEGFCKVCDNDD